MSLAAASGAVLVLTATVLASTASGNVDSKSRRLASGSHTPFASLAALSAALLGGWAIWPVVRRRRRFGGEASPVEHPGAEPDGDVVVETTASPGTGGAGTTSGSGHRALTINAVSLMTATIVTSGVGLVFWAVAARLRPASVVGHASAAVSALILLASISQLNLTNVFIRLLPASGRLGRRLVRRGYLVVAALAVLVGAAYVLSGLSSGVVTHDWEARMGFIVAVPVLAIFALQDSVLTALRLTPWVPVENVSFAMVKLALLPVLAWLSIDGGIVVAWVLPAALAVAVISWLLFGRVIPKRDVLDGMLPPRRRLLSFVAGEYATSIFGTVTVQVLPLMIVWRLGAASAAYFTIPWLISSGITLVLYNIAASYVVEVASGHSEPRALLRRSLLMWAGLTLAALIVCVIGAEPLLSVAGSEYARHGAGVLRLSGLATPFGAIIAVYCTRVWLQQRVWTLAACQAASGVLLLSGTLVLLPHLGLIAVGWANLGTQVLLAAFLFLVEGLRRRRRGSLTEAW